MSTSVNSVSIESAVRLPRFQTKSGEQTVDLKRIVYLTAQRNYTYFYLSDDEQVTATLPLSYYASLLEKHGFIRVHKSYLLNNRFLGQCSFKKGDILILPNRHTISVSRRRRSEFLKVFKQRKTKKQDKLTHIKHIET